MKNEIIKIEVSVPHRISGFFEIVDEVNGKVIENPSEIGSTGAGFNLSAYGKTTIIAKTDIKINSFEIFINGINETKNANTSKYIINQVIKLLDTPINIEVRHDFQLPVGCGYGASGSGALGLIFGLNKLYNLNLNNNDLGKYAHISEVINKTGLGTVCGQLTGGLSILTKAGYPCFSQKIEVPSDITIICISLGPIYTKSILTNLDFRNRIKIAGRGALRKLLHTPDIKTFVTTSYEFVKKIEILNILNLSPLEDILIELNKLDIIGASMNQLGRSVYAICKEKNKNQVTELLHSFNEKLLYQELKISDSGPRVL